MKPFRQQPYLLVLTAVLSSYTASAIRLDHSCENYKDFLTPGFKAAQKLAKLSRKVLGEFQEANDSPTVNAANDLVSYLFHEVEQDEDYLEDILDVFEAAEATLQFGEQLDVVEESGYATLTSFDLLVLCDQSRYRPHPTKDGKMKDLFFGGTRSNHVLEACDAPLIDENGDSPFRIGAISLSPKPETNYPLQLQLCFGLLRQYNPTNAMASDVLDLVASTEATNLEVDVVAETLARYLLHEITHLIGYNVIDINSPDSYGWENTLSIGQTRDASKNADNYAIFGVLAGLMNPESTDGRKIKVTKTGDLEVIPDGGDNSDNVAVRKRSDGIFHRWMSAALSTFETRIVPRSPIADHVQGQPVTASPNLRFGLSKRQFFCTDETVMQCAPDVVCHAPMYNACDNGQCICKLDPITTTSDEAPSDPAPTGFVCTDETINQCSPAVICGAPQFIACVEGKCVCQTPELPPSPGPGSPDQPATTSTSPPAQREPAIITSATTASGPLATTYTITRGEVTSSVVYQSQTKDSTSAAWSCVGSACNSDCPWIGGCNSQTTSTDVIGGFVLCCGWGLLPIDGIFPPLPTPPPQPKPEPNQPDPEPEPEPVPGPEPEPSDPRPSTTTAPCAAKITSACHYTTKRFIPVGETTWSSTVITESCSTITACSAELTAVSTTITSTAEDAEGTEIFDEFTVVKDGHRAYFSSLAARGNLQYRTFSRSDSQSPARGTTTSGSVSTSTTASSGPITEAPNLCTPYQDPHAGVQYCWCSSDGVNAFTTPMLTATTGNPCAYTTLDIIPTPTVATQSVWTHTDLYGYILACPTWGVQHIMPGATYTQCNGPEETVGFSKPDTSNKVASECELTAWEQRQYVCFLASCDDKIINTFSGANLNIAIVSEDGSISDDIVWDDRERSYKSDSKNPQPIHIDGQEMHIMESVDIVWDGAETCYCTISGDRVEGQTRSVGDGDLFNALKGELCFCDFPCHR